MKILETSLQHAQREVCQHISDQAIGRPAGVEDGSYGTLLNSAGAESDLLSQTATIIARDKGLREIFGQMLAAELEIVRHHEDLMADAGICSAQKQAEFGALKIR